MTTDTPAEVRALPCPHCGGPAKRLEPMGFWRPDGYTSNVVRYTCADISCNLDQYGEGMEERALANWNTRAPSASQEDDEAPCPVCGCEVRGQGGYLQCECPAPSASQGAEVEPGDWQWRGRIKGGAWDAWENGRYGQEVPPFMEIEERLAAHPVTDTAKRAAEDDDKDRFETWSDAELAAQCRMQARAQIDPEFSRFLLAVADRIRPRRAAREASKAEEKQ